MKKLLLYTFLLTLTIWSYAQYPQVDKRLIFQEQFTSEYDCLKNGGTPSNIDFAYGSGTFNGTSSKVNYDLNLNGVYSVRVRCNPTSFAADRVILDLRGSALTGIGIIYITGGVSTSTSGTVYVNGIATTTTVAGVNNEIFIAGITLRQGTGLNKTLIGSTYGNSFEFLGTIDYVEIYEGTLTASEVKNLFLGLTNIPFPDMVQDNNLQLLSKVESQTGVIQDRYNTITNTSVELQKLGNTYVQSYNRSDSKLDLGSDFIGTGDITFCVWLKGEDGSETNFARIFSNGKLEIREQRLSNLYQIESDGATFASVTATGLDMNKLRFLCITRTAAGIVNGYIGYLDSAPVLSGSANRNSGTPSAGTTNVIIGNNNGQTATYKGYMFTPQIYSGLMNIQQITNIWSTTKPTK